MIDEGAKTHPNPEGVTQGSWDDAKSKEQGAWSMEQGAWSKEQGARSTGQGAIIKEALYFRYFAVYDSVHFFKFSGVPSKTT